MPLVLDLECNTKTSFKRKANPFDPEAKIVAIAFKEVGTPFEETIAWHLQHLQPGSPGQSFPGIFRTALKKTKLLVGHNIKFDLLHLLNDETSYEAYREWVVAGGRVWDTQLAEYLLQGMRQQWHMNSLEEVSVLCGGTTKLNAVKLLWDEGVDTEDIDPDLLMEYLVGTGPGTDNLGDIGNTELVFQHQWKRAKSAGQIKSIMVSMTGLMATIEIERNGMFVDKAGGLAIAEELREDLRTLREDLGKFVPANLPFEFNWGSTDQRSAIIFGGSIKYNPWEYQLEDGTWHEESLLPDQAPLAYRAIDAKAYSNGTLVAEGEPVPSDAVRYLSGKKKGEPKLSTVKVADISRPIKRRCERYFKFDGVTSPEKKWAADKPGFYSTAADVIEALSNRNVPFLKLLAKSLKLAKDLTTYFISEDGEKGMLTLVNEVGIIHHMLNMCSTVTARLSSSSPNLQNIPKGGKSKVKEIFVSRYKDGAILQSDFTQLEIYVQALITQSKQLIKDLQDGLDLHCVRVSQKKGITYEESVRLCKTEALPEWVAERTAAKIFSFQRAYGAGASLISDGTGIPFDDVQALITAEETRYPEIEPFFRKLSLKVEQSAIPGRYVQHPLAPALPCRLDTGSYVTPDGKRYSYTMEPSPGYMVKRGIAATFSPTQLKNYVVQGAGAEFAKLGMFVAMWLLYRFRKELAGRAVLCNQVHDAVYADSDPSVRVHVAAILQAGMEMANNAVECLFDWKIEAPVPSDTTYGPSMAESFPMEDENFPQLVSKFKAVVTAELFGGFIPSFSKDK